MTASPAENIDPEVLRSLLQEATQEQLEPLAPEDALEMYIQQREDELAESTLRTHQSRISHFVTWCHEQDLTNLNDLTGRNIQEFRTWRKDDLEPTSFKSNMRTFRIFLEKCAQFDGVRSDLPSKVDIPSLSINQQSRDDMVPASQAKEILNYLSKYHYASLEHIVWLLLAGTGMRTCELQALDLDDHETTDSGGVLRLTHRPDSGTSLKNKNRSERAVHIPHRLNETIVDYLDGRRPDVTDQFGRSPLLATEHGRISRSTIRKYVYKWTRPCAVTGECPHDRDISSCAAAETPGKASECPSSKSAHPVRRGYITNELGAEVPETVISDRCDVSPGVMADHYDGRSEEEKMELRAEIRDAIYKERDSDAYYG